MTELGVENGALKVLNSRIPNVRGEQALWTMRTLRLTTAGDLPAALYRENSMIKFSSPAVVGGHPKRAILATDLLCQKNVGRGILHLD